jgi:LysR family transcriptional regulator for bpeEF and oprC
VNLLECMEMFVEVVEREGFSRAATTLQMSPAKVSTQIHNLEEHLGVQLLSRTTRSCTLTEEGETYYARCKQILNDVSAAEASLSGARENPQGRLRIDASVTLINRVLLPVIYRFREKYPAIELEFLHTAHVFDVKQQGMDVMLRLGPLEDSSMIARPMARTDLVTAAAPSYLARRGVPRTPDELARHDCLNYLDPFTGRLAEWNFVRGDERFIFTPERKLSFNQGESRLAAAVQGLGIYRGLSVGLDRLLQSGALQLLLEDWTTPAPMLYVAHANHRNLPVKIRVFVDFLLECFPPSTDMEAELPTVSDHLVA